MKMKNIDINILPPDKADFTHYFIFLTPSFSTQQWVKSAYQGVKYSLHSIRGSEGNKFAVTKAATTVEQC